jgi:hypothetical protein
MCWRPLLISLTAWSDGMRTVHALFALGVLVQAQMWSPATASAQAAPPPRVPPYELRGDTLIQRTPGPAGIELRYLVRSDSVIVIRVGSRVVRQAVNAEHEEVMRAEARRLAAGGARDSVWAESVLRSARQRYQSVPPGYSANRVLPSGDTITLRGDTIRIQRTTALGGEHIIITLTSSGATLLSGGAPRKLPERLADLLALLRYSESALLHIDELLAGLAGK